MPTVVYRVTRALSSLLEPFPIGTNLGLFHLLFMLVSGRLLESRGAVVPGLAALGLPPPAVRRAWAALAYGHWETDPLVTRWQQWVHAEARWQPAQHGPYCPVACDLVGFFRPRLQGCVTTHYHPAAGKALPAIPVGIAARVGGVGEQRLAIPCLMLRADPQDPSEAALQRRLLTATGQLLTEQEALVCDAGFPLTQVLQAGVPRFLVRGAKNFTARRAHLPAYPGKGRPHLYGNVVRPLPRTYQGRTIVATPCDREETWQEDGCILKACFWERLVVRDGKPGDPTFTCIVIHDPRYNEPLLLLTNLGISGAVALALYHHRWPIEQLPLVGKQILGAQRQYLFAPESRQRLPELALLASSILSYEAATSPAIPTGFWDRAARPTSGRLRRVLSRVRFSEVGPLPERIREKATATAHLPKGVAAHRRQRRDTPTTQPLPRAA
jgi:hypothetical protein